MTRLLLVALWLLSGGAVTSGVYWGFLNTPESTMLMLAVSTALALVALALAAFTVNAAVLAWSRGIGRDTIRAAAAGIPSAVPALVVGLAAWWVADRADAWVALNTGPISAWLIARVGWADASPLFTIAGYLTAWVRWVVGPLLALSLVAAILAEGWRAGAGFAWVRHALAPRRLALATLTVGALVAAPWVYVVPWRPRGLPATSIELAFIAGKLAVCAALIAAGLALIVRLAQAPTGDS